MFLINFNGCCFYDITKNVHPLVIPGLNILNLLTCRNPFMVENDRKMRVKLMLNNCLMVEVKFQLFTTKITNFY